MQIYFYLNFNTIFISVEKQEEMKCMVRLLTMALGMDEKRAENLLSPTSTKNTARVTKGEEVE